MNFSTIGNRSMIFIAALTLLFAQSAFAQSDDDAAAMEAYMTAATPGPHHQALAAKAGSWKTTNKIWMPGQPPMESTGTSELATVLDGRFLQEVTKATMMGMPWEGRGTFGYDNSTKKHTGNWFDSFGTTMMSFEGTCDATCKTITMTGEYFDPAMKSTKRMKTVTTVVSDDETLLTMYDIAKDGSETKIGEFRYERTVTQAKR